MYRQTAFLILAVVAGVLIGALGASTWSGQAQLSDSAKMSGKSSIRQLRQDPSREPDSEHLTDVVESLAQVLNDEITERRVLSEQLEQLKSELLDLKQNLRVRVEEAFQADNASRRQESGDAVAPASREERLAAAGFTRQQLESIDRLQVEAQLRQLELDDRARREGWINTPRYVQESQELAAGAGVVRDALGDELYDRYLFASGLPNRIAVASVIETSPAQRAGFQRGDVVIRYGGEKVFSSQQLVNLRSSGERGEPVTVEILRNDQLLQLTIPRGPMGMSTEQRRVDPAAPRG